MSQRVQIGLLFAFPVVLLGALYVLGTAIPVPILGREYVVRVELPDGSATIGLPEIEGPSDPSRPLVLIDAGHGGPDPGTSSESYREKTIVLGLARANCAIACWKKAASAWP